METTYNDNGLYRDHRVMLGLYVDNGKENENYYSSEFRACGARLTIYKVHGTVLHFARRCASSDYCVGG